MYIKKLTLKNIKAFEALSFDFTRPDGSFAGWTVFVGGNGSGKTTILRTIALSLMGPKAGDVILGRHQGWISKGAVDGSSIATICVDPSFDAFNKAPLEKTPLSEFEAGVQWHREELDDCHEAPKNYVEFEATAGSRRAKRGPWYPPANGWFAAGYGPMRRLTGTSEAARSIEVGDGRECRFITLFWESAALEEGDFWLRWMHARTLETDRPDRNDIESLVQLVTALLNDGLLPVGMKVSRITVDQVFVMDGTGVEIPLDDVSDGCRSILAMVMDLVCKSFNACWDNFDTRFDSQGHPVVEIPGIVLIDEVEAHLHPEWQRDMPEWFKKHFPNIQFIVSTHSPLIAQAADDNGLFILPGQGDVDSEPRQASADELERIRLRTAYDALLESAFGLNTTRPPSTQKLIERWQWLDAKRRAGKLREEEVGEYSVLRSKMHIAFPAQSELADV